MLREQFHMHRRYHGIASSVPYCRYDPQAAEEGELPGRTRTPYVCIMTALERGLGAECMKLASRRRRARGHHRARPWRRRAAGRRLPAEHRAAKGHPDDRHPARQAPAIRRAIYEGMRLERRGAASSSPCRSRAPWGCMRSASRKGGEAMIPAKFNEVTRSLLPVMALVLVLAFTVVRPRPRSSGASCWARPCCWWAWPSSCWARTWA